MVKQVAGLCASRAGNASSSRSPRLSATRGTQIRPVSSRAYGSQPSPAAILQNPDSSSSTPSMAVHSACRSVSSMPRDSSPPNHPIDEIGAGLPEIAAVDPDVPPAQEFDSGPWRPALRPDEMRSSAGGNHFQIGKRISLSVGAESMPAVEIGIALLRRSRDLVGEKPPVRDQPLREWIERDVHELANRLCSGIQDTSDCRVTDEYAQRGPGRGQLWPADSLRIHPVDLEPKFWHRSIRYRPATRRRQADVPCTTRSRGSPTVPRRWCRHPCTTRSAGTRLPTARRSRLDESRSAAIP